MTFLATVLALLAGAVLTGLTTRTAYRSGYLAGLERSTGVLRTLQVQLAELDAERAAMHEAAADDLEATR